MTAGRTQTREGAGHAWSTAQDVTRAAGMAEARARARQARMAARKAQAGRVVGDIAGDVTASRTRKRKEPWEPGQWDALKMCETGGDGTSGQ